jgi:hypothetical protein
VLLPLPPLPQTDIFIFYIPLTFMNLIKKCLFAAPLRKSGTAFSSAKALSDETH